MCSDSSPKHQAASNVKTQPGMGRFQARTTDVDSWSDSMEPDERRRIQNRNAQRKFRQKIRDQRDLAEREAQNQRFSDGSYTVPMPRDLAAGLEAESDLPWGSLSMGLIITRGHEAGNFLKSERGVVPLRRQRAFVFGGNQACQGLSPASGYNNTSETNMHSPHVQYWSPHYTVLDVDLAGPSDLVASVPHLGLD